MNERKWEELSLNEKLDELGFVPGAQGDFEDKEGRLTSDAQRRLHAALDQLLDTAQMCDDIVEMVEPAGNGHPTGDELNICVAIYELLTDESTEDTPVDDEPTGEIEKPS